MTPMISILAAVLVGTLCVCADFKDFIKDNELYESVYRELPLIAGLGQRVAEYAGQPETRVHYVANEEYGFCIYLDSEANKQGVTIDLEKFYGTDTYTAPDFPIFISATPWNKDVISWERQQVPFLGTIELADNVTGYEIRSRLSAWYQNSSNLVEHAADKYYTSIDAYIDRQCKKGHWSGTANTKGKCRTVGTKKVAKSVRIVNHEGRKYRYLFFPHHQCDVPVLKSMDVYPGRSYTLKEKGKKTYGIKKI